MRVRSVALEVKRVEFPSLRELLIRLIVKYHDSGYQSGMSRDALIQFIFKKIEQLRESIINYDQKLISELTENASVSLEKSSDTLESLIRELKSKRRTSNEFFTIFDINRGKEVYYDERLQSVLGIHPENFQSSVLGEENPAQSIYYWDDVYHVLRHAMISYSVLAIPGLKWSSQRDHNLVRFRMNSAVSSKDSLRKLPYVTVEKRCYLVYNNESEKSDAPLYHYDEISIYPHMPLEYVTRVFVSKDGQSEYINAYCYLFNLYLIGLSPKYLLILDEGQHHDRNKAIAVSFQKNIKQATGLDVEFDDHKIADCFAKTIRKKIEDVINLWEHRKNSDKVKIRSDMQAVHGAKKLGLLPIPHLVKDMLYNMISLK